MHFRSRAQQRIFCIQILIGSTLLIAGSFLLGKFSQPQQTTATSIRNNGSGRSLLQFFTQPFLSSSLGGGDPKSIVARTAKDTVTIYLIRERNNNNEILNPAHSIFKTDTLHKYGSGRVQYMIREQAQCNQQCDEALPAEQPMLQHAPCLAVSRYTKKMYCDADHVKCNYPQCKTLVSNDDLCAMSGSSFDSRQYYTSDRPELGYVPLGMRYDAWMSFQSIKGEFYHDNQFFIPPPTKRRYAFNAIFSQGNLIRNKLALSIEHNGDTSKLPIFKSISEVAPPAANKNNNNNPRKRQPQEVQGPQDELPPSTSSDEYMQVLLDSIFTLAPAGLNPECYRLHEAVEAGSIPIISHEDLHGLHHPNTMNRKDLRNVEHPCKNSLLHWYGAPIVVLDTWNDLYSTVEILLEDPALLDDMQHRLRIWYDDYMKRVVSKFEDFLLDPTFPVVMDSGSGNEGGEEEGEGGGGIEKKFTPPSPSEETDPLYTH